MRLVVLPPDSPQLGKPLAEYSASGGGVLISVLLFGFLFSLGAFLFVVPLVFLFLKPFDGQTFTVALALGAGMMAVAALFIRVTLRVGRSRAIVCSEGLLYVYGDKPRAFPWEQIAFFREVSTHNPHSGGLERTYIIEREDGERASFGYLLKNVAELAEIVRRETANRLLPKARTAVETGAIVPFGPVSVSRDGLLHGEQFLIWLDLEGVEVAEGIVRIGEKGNAGSWARIPTNDFCNLFVFVSLIQTISECTVIVR